METLDKDIYISQELKYYDLSNVFFESPINEEMMNELKDIFFSINNINQIYFRKDADIDTIKKVKYLLEISPTMNDELVDKFILNIDNIDRKELFDLCFFNSNMWWVQYKVKNMELMTISLDDYIDIEKKLDLLIQRLRLNKYSEIEKIAKIYDYCKSYELDLDNEYVLKDIIDTKKSDSKTLMILFQKLLQKISIDSYIGESLTDKEKSLVLIARIVDDKYNINGIYLFDLLSDYVDEKDIPSKKYKNLNYNYFCMLLKNYSNTVFNDRLIGILKCFVHDYEYDFEKISYVPTKEISDLEELLKGNFFSIHNEIDETKEIEDETLLKVFYNINNKDIHKLLKENYYIRKDKLLNYSINE